LNYKICLQNYINNNFEQKRQCYKTLKLDFDCDPVFDDILKWLVPEKWKSTWG